MFRFSLFLILHPKKFLLKVKFVNINNIIFYRLEPDKTLATIRLSGRKKNKERLTIALCTNADGSHKTEPLIIGKSSKPQCFKNVNIKNLPIKYCSNPKAWMLTTVFQDWIQEFNNVIIQKYNGQHVLLLLDNCPSHKIGGLALSHVDVLFLPPNTTSKLQPMDAGIIMSFKRHYRRHHVKCVLIFCLMIIVLIFEYLHDFF